MTSKRANKAIPPIITIIGLFIIVLLLNKFHSKQDIQVNTNTAGPGFVYGQCRNCEPIAGTGIPIEDDRGEYLDVSLIQKLQKLAGENKEWHITEAYPPTVRHLSFCHYNGTCADIALLKTARTPANLSALCRDALNSGLTVLNEYSKIILPSGSSCPAADIFETTTGDNIHVSNN